MVVKMVSIVQTASAQLPWSHNILIFDKIKDDDIRLWYINETTKAGWSYDTLAMQIKIVLIELGTGFSFVGSEYKVTFYCPCHPQGFLLLLSILDKMPHIGYHIIVWWNSRRSKS